MLPKEEQSRSTRVCITLISALPHWAPKHVPNPNGLQAGPASHARAVLQLLARLTKSHSLAQMVKPFVKQQP